MVGGQGTFVVERKRTSFRTGMMLGEGRLGGQNGTERTEWAFGSFVGHRVSQMYSCLKQNWRDEEWFRDCI